MFFRAIGYLKGILIMPRTKNPTTKTPTTKTPAAPSVAPVKETAPVKSAAAEVKPVEAAKAEKKRAVRKSAAVNAEKPAAKKTASKKAASAATPVVKKRTPRKPKTVTVDDVVAKVSKRIDKEAAKQVAANGKAAIDIKLYGSFEAHMYIEIKDGVVTVAPFDYIEKDIEAAVPVDVALAIADGKTSVKEAVENGSLYVYGNVHFALLFAKLFK